jgi:hypothetical protein
MTLKTTIELLKRHNAWRKGADMPMTDPKKLGQALDEAIVQLNLMANYKARNKELEAENKALRGTTTLIEDESCWFPHFKTTCCNVGFITTENYCPKCGRKIIKH